MNTNYIDELNESQCAAVTYNDGPSLVIAGGRFGKTRVLTYKIAYLLEQNTRSSVPWNILALTFTNKGGARDERAYCPSGRYGTGTLFVDGDFPFHLLTDSSCPKQHLSGSLPSSPSMIRLIVRVCSVPSSKRWDWTRKLINRE